MPWPLHRVATSGKYSDSLHIISTEWTLVDVWQANDVIDAHDDAAARAEKNR